MDYIQNGSTDLVRHLSMYSSNIFTNSWVFFSLDNTRCVCGLFTTIVTQQNMATTMEPAREKALQDYRKKLLEHKEVESRLKESK